MTAEKDKRPQQGQEEIKQYLKALPIRQLSDIDAVKLEVSSGNIVVAKITSLAKKSLEDTERAVDELCIFVNKIGGDIARLGDKRLVITPPSVKIWKKEKEME